MGWGFSKPEEPRGRESSWLDPRLVVAPSPIEGRGLFAGEPIGAGEVVVRLGGERLTDEAFRERGLVEYSSVAIGERLNLLLIDDEPVNFGNHSCDPNLRMADEVTRVARRPIAAGEEVTSDYAVYTADLSWSMFCRCGSPLCRGVVANDDRRRPELRARYANHFGPFLNRRIARAFGP